MKLALDAPGKVNLCLFLGPLREDGRHELVTVIESVSLADHLTITTRPDGEDRVRCAGVDEPNLVTLALEKLRAHDWGGPPLTVEIDKRLPVAGGMGGGSADAAALLRAARHLSPLPDHTVGQIAAELGADVPSQLEPGLTLATGAGEQVQALAPLPEHAFVIIPATTKLSTAAVYSEADRLGLPRDTAELASIDPLERLGVNDLQPATLSLCPEVGVALQAADDTLVSGSGPTVFALHWGHDAPERARHTAEELRPRFPGTVVALPVGSDAGGLHRLA